MKIRETISNDFDFKKCYLGHEPEQYSRDFSRRLNTLHNIGGIVTFKPYNSQSI